MHKKRWLLLTIGYMLVLGCLSLMSDDGFPKIDLEYDDKIFHIFAYGLLCGLWYVSLRQLRKTDPIAIAVVLALIYGIILEVLQGQLTADRKLDFLDVVANTIGITIVSILIVIRNKTIVKK